LGNATGYWRTQVPTMLKWTKREKRERERENGAKLYV
jgi:hypothetical protein